MLVIALQSFLGEPYSMATNEIRDIPDGPILDGLIAAGYVEEYTGQGTGTGTGTVGPQGPKGDKGDKGDPGEAGPEGPRGPQGIQGLQGIQGPKGDKGDIGATGATGATGAQGPKGATGAAGAVGPQGPAGAAGATGPQGATGAKGAKGDKGDPGQSFAISKLYATPAALAAETTPVAEGNMVAVIEGTAAKVYMRSQATTATGNDLAGYKYLLDLAEASVIKGDKGDKGETGAQGPQGAEGPAGPAGATGPKGATGAAGATGPAGAKGADGQGVPTGGTAGQVLAKVDAQPYNAAWIDLPEGGGGTNVTKETDTPNGSVLVDGVELKVYDDSALKKSVADGKSLIAATVSEGGAPTAADATWDDINDNIRELLGLEGKVSIINAEACASLYPPINAYNGDKLYTQTLGNTWLAYNGIDNPYIILELSKPSSVRRLKIYISNNGPTVSRTLKVEGGSTADNLTELSSELVAFVNNSVVNSRFMKLTTNTNTKFIKISSDQPFYGGAGQYACGFNEIEVFK